MLLLKGTMFPQIGLSNGDKQTHNFSFGTLTSLTQEALWVECFTIQINVKDFQVGI